MMQMIINPKSEKRKLAGGFVPRVGERIHLKKYDENYIVDDVSYVVMKDGTLGAVLICTINAP